MKRTQAKFQGKCPQCLKRLEVNTPIALPEVSNGAGGNRFSTWYCVPCATDLEEIGPVHGPFLDYAAKEAWRERIRPISERMKRRRARNQR